MFENYTSASVNMPAVLITNGLGICLMLAILLSRYRRTRTTSIDGKFTACVCSALSSAQWRQRVFCWKGRPSSLPGSCPSCAVR